MANEERTPTGGAAAAARLARVPLRYTVDARGCWIWAGRVNDDGYGVHSGALAHRAAYAQVVGPIPAGLSVLHRCDVPPCINPRHLFLGTQTDNMRDCARKGRNYAPDSRGERHGAAKLTNAQAAEIRRRRNAGEPGRALARAYGVHESTISEIVHGKTYRGDA